MTDNFIQLNKSDIIRLKIRTDEGKDTGEYLEFDLSDIELPLKYQELIEKNKKNKRNLKNQLFMIEKRPDAKGKSLLSRNQEDTIKALNEFFIKEIEVYNIFLGPRGVEKLLNGRKFTWTTLQELDELIEKQILPHLDANKDRITEKIREKYGKPIMKKDDIEVIE